MVAGRATDSVAPMIVAVDGRHLAARRGVARYSRRMCAALAAAGVEVRALAPGRGAVEPVAGVDLVRPRLGSRALHGITALTGAPSLLSLCGGDVAWVPAPAPVAPGRPYVLTIHDLSWLERPGDFGRYERAWHAAARVERLARRAAAVVCDADAVAASLSARWGLTAQVIEPGVDRPAPGVVPERRERPYVLYVGAREPRKGLDVLARAWPQAALDADLVLAGAGPVSVPGAIDLGPVPDTRLHALYAGALAVVLPSLLEGFGLTPREAAAHGVPAIVSDLPTLQLPGTLRFRPGDATALAGALRALPAERERLVAELEPPRSWDAAGAELAAVLAEAAR